MKILTTDQHWLYVHQLPRFNTDMELAEEDVVIALIGDEENLSVINGEFDFEFGAQGRITHLIVNTEHGRTHLPYEARIQVDVTCIETIETPSSTAGQQVPAYSGTHSADDSEFEWEPQFITHEREY